MAGNAIVRLTCNINVTDGLTNGVKRTSQKIITKVDDDTSVVAFLVKFKDSNVEVKIKVGSHYKNQYPDAVPIFRFGASF